MVTVYFLVEMQTLSARAFELNEEAYEMLEGIVNQYLAKHKPQNSASTVEMWKLPTEYFLPEL